MFVVVVVVVGAELDDEMLAVVAAAPGTETGRVLQVTQEGRQSKSQYVCSVYHALHVSCPEHQQHEHSLISGKGARDGCTHDACIENSHGLMLLE